jgi:hypothetical protein
MGLAGAHVRELRGHEEAVQEHQHENREEEERRGHGRLGRRA